MSATIIPAETGRYIVMDLSYDKHEKSTSVQFAHDVIAWSIEDGRTRPVSVLGVKFIDGDRIQYAIYDTKREAIIYNGIESTVTNDELIDSMNKLLKRKWITNSAVHNPLEPE